ncbi:MULTISPECIES: GIY-YIG nuclease family protein [Paenibacillus]|uniref:GIY-YIG nuclease family protein n=1 Tax=Paenibacillus TaxID=44249 RepID=UPI002FE1C6B2
MIDQLQNLPALPGVYMMKDGHGDILYVGKSKNLKQRVKSYFTSSEKHSRKTQRLVNNVKDLEIRITDTEFEAFMLECRLIHELRPMYNKKMKSPQAYVYVKVRTGKDGRRSLELGRRGEPESDLPSFGPYTASRHTVGKALTKIKESLRIACVQSAGARGPCLNVSLGLCLGGCLGGVAARESDRVMERLIALLEARDFGLLEEMQREMDEAAGEFDFERAARYRDGIDALKLLLRQEKVISFAEQNRMILLSEPLNERESKLFLVRRHQILYSIKYNPLEADRIKPVSSLMNWLHSRCVEETAATHELTREEIDEAQIIYSYLRNSTCRHLILSEAWLEPDGEDDLRRAVVSFLGGERLMTGGTG